MQIAREPVRAVGRLEIDGHALARRVFHAPAVVNIGEQEVAALLPPERPLGGSQRAAEAGCQFLDRLVHGDDLVELRRKLLDARLHLRLCLRSRVACAARGQAGDRAGHLQRATASNFALAVHGDSSLAIASMKRPSSAAEQRDELATLHSITSSASVSRLSEIFRPSVFAVLKLITSSNLLANMIGRSPGLVPLRIRAAYSPTCRWISTMS